MYTLLSSATSHKFVNYITTTIMIFIVIVSFIGFALAIAAPQHIMFRILTVGISFCGIMAILLLYYSRTRRDLLLNIVNRLYTNTPNFVRKDISAEAEAFTEAKYWRWAVCYILTNMPDVFAPYVYFFINEEIDFTDPNLMSIPYFLQVKTDTVWKYLGTNILLAFIFSILILLYWCVTFFVIYVMNNLEHHIKEINVQFKDALHRYLRSYCDHNQGVKLGMNITYKEMKNQKDVDTALENEFITLIQYQQFIHR